MTYIEIGWDIEKYKVLIDDYFFEGMVIMDYERVLSKKRAAFFFGKTALY